MRWNMGLCRLNRSAHAVSDRGRDQKPVPPTRRLPGYAMRTSPHGIAGRGRISSLAVGHYQALHPITDRVRDRHYTEGNEEMLSNNLPRSNRLCSCNEETQGREQE